MKQAHSYSRFCSFVCAKCKVPAHGKDVFKWSICNHSHCKKCIKIMINSSLSVSNTLPQCEYPNCNQLLKLEDVNTFPVSLLSSKYTFDTKNIKQCEKEKYLIFGSIRKIAQHSPNYKHIIPQDIIKLIHDYYNLILVERFPCHSCLCAGYQWKKEKNTQKCTNCNCYGIAYIDCNKCKGIGYKSIQTNCGSGYVDCFKINCIPCGGSGKSKLTEQCKIINCFTGTLTKWTTNKYDCKTCKGQKYLMKLDFIKLFNNQILCLTCKQYHPINKIMYWSKCSHTYCLSCFEKYHLPLMKRQMYYGRRILPICPQTNCDEQFAENNIQIMEKKLRNFNLYTITIDKLKKMYGVKDTFVGKKCNKHHKMVYLQKCVICNGKYGLQCNYVVRWKDCAHLCCFKCVNGNVDVCLGNKCKSISRNYKIKFKCEMCKQLRWNEIFLWTNCKHTYCKNCIESYFGKTRNMVKIEGNSIFYARKKHLKHIDFLSAPVCFNRSCKQLLSIVDYKSI